MQVHNSDAAGRDDSTLRVRHQRATSDATDVLRPNAYRRWADARAAT
jgi:hypothetical protein